MNGISPHKAALLEAYRIRWTPGFNDMSAAGWLTVAAYAAAGVLAWRAARRGGSAGERFEPRFWWAVTAAMVLLGINKQFDLHILLTDAGRAWAVDHGWYRERRAFQLAFMLVAAVGGAIAVVVGLAATRRRHPSIRLATAGLVVILAYVLLRAASFHHVDQFFRTSLFGLRWNGLVELAGVALVGLAAWRCRP